jgi:hypothetical protein
MSRSDEIPVNTGFKTGQSHRDAIANAVTWRHFTRGAIVMVITEHVSEGGYRVLMGLAGIHRCLLPVCRRYATQSNNFAPAR